MLPSETSDSSFQLPLASPVPAAHSSTPAVPHVPSYVPPPAQPQQQPYQTSYEKTPTPTPVVQQPPPTYTPTALVISHAEALWAFQGSEAGDLSFASGVTIEVVEKVKDDWWRGRVLGGNGEIGLFPSAYVRETQQLAGSIPVLPPRKQAGGYGAGGNPITDVAYGQPQQHQEAAAAPKEESKFAKNGSKIGKKVGNAALFGAGATIGANVVNSIF